MWRPSAPPFVEVDEVEHGFHGAGFEADFLEALADTLGCRIAPSPFGHEAVPNLDILKIRFAALGEGPCEQFVITSSLECLGGEIRVVDAEKVASAGVETSRVAIADHRRPFVGKFPLGAEADFIEHPPEINDAAHHFIGAAKSGDKCGIRLGHETNKHRAAGRRKLAFCVAPRAGSAFLGAAGSQRLRRNNYVSLRFGVRGQVRVVS